jgi:hypothetical protein
VRSRLLPVAALLAAACGSSSQEIGAVLSRPAALAVFRGESAERPGVSAYLAIASARADELRIVDLVDDKAVPAPVTFAPLSVPTGARPSRLASVSLHDDGVEATADALVAIPGGTAELQLVETWSPNTRVVPGATLDLGALAPGAEILAILGVPAPAPDGEPIAGRARFLVALSGGRLAVVDVSRGAEGEVALGASPPILDLAPRVDPAGSEPFDVVSLAISPDNLYVYLASPDPIGGVLGVGRMDLTGDPAAWRIRPMDARAPTTLVAAFELSERGDATDDFQTTTVQRVYAVLDETACGRDARVPCGIAVLDPVSGDLLPDPAGEMPYLAPIPVPGLPIAIVPSGPPANGTEGDGNPKWVYPEGAPPGDPDRVVILRMSPGSGVQYTSAMAVVPTTDGRAYWVDLARWRTPADQSIIRPVAGASGTRATEAVSLPGLDPDGSFAGAYLGVCDYFEAGSCLFDPLLVPPPSSEDPPDPTLPQVRPTRIVERMGLTPGYTPDESWTLAYRAALPRLGSRRGVVGRRDGVLYAAIQVPNGADAPPGAPPFLGVLDVTDPASGIHAVATHGEADDVEIELDAADEGRCDVDGREDPGSPGLPIPDLVAAAVDLLARDAGIHPGGAVALAEPFATPEGGACGGIGEGETVPATITIRTRGLVLSGALAGYAGRPLLAERYALEYQDEDALSCLAPGPACEALALARRSRRIFYLADLCPDPNVEELPGVEEDPCVAAGFGPPRFPEGSSYPHPRGPSVAFWVAIVPSVTSDAGTPDDPTDDEYDHELRPGAAIRFGTASGMVPTSRRPIVNGSVVGAALPTDVAVFDRSTLAGHEEDGLRFYVSYPGNQVLVFSPAADPGSVGVIR